MRHSPHTTIFKTGVVKATLSGRLSVNNPLCLVAVKFYVVCRIVLRWIQPLSIVGLISELKPLFLGILSVLPLFRKRDILVLTSVVEMAGKKTSGHRMFALMNLFVWAKCCGCEVLALVFFIVHIVEWQFLAIQWGGPWRELCCTCMSLREGEEGLVSGDVSKYRMWLDSPQLSDNHITSFSLSGDVSKYRTWLDSPQLSDNYITSFSLFGDIHIYWTWLDSPQLSDNHITSFSLSGDISKYWMWLDSPQLSDNHITSFSLSGDIPIYWMWLDSPQLSDNHITFFSLSGDIPIYWTCLDSPQLSDNHITSFSLSGDIPIYWTWLDSPQLSDNHITSFSLSGDIPIYWTWLDSPQLSDNHITSFSLFRLLKKRNTLFQ